MTNAIIVDGKVYQRVHNFSRKFNPLDMCFVPDSERRLDDTFEFVGWFLPDEAEVAFEEMWDNDQIYFDIAGYWNEKHGRE